MGRWCDWRRQVRKLRAVDDLYLDPLHYDRMFPDPGRAADFYLSQVRRFGEPALELACGTGRLTIPLAHQGLDMTGLDYSPQMLAEARRKATATGVAVSWIEGDMRDFDLGRRFRTIYLPANALAHLHTNRDMARMLACVQGHLVPGGAFLLQTFLPNLEILRRDPGRRYPFADYELPDGGRVVVTESNVYEADTQINRITTYARFPGEVEERVGQLNLRMHFPQELEAHLTYNGYRILEKRGGTDGSAFTAQSDVQLLICKSAADE